MNKHLTFLPNGFIETDYYTYEEARNVIYRFMGCRLCKAYYPNCVKTYYRMQILDKKLPKNPRKYYGIKWFDWAKFMTFKEE